MVRKFRGLVTNVSLSERVKRRCSSGPRVLTGRSACVYQETAFPHARPFLSLISSNVTRLTRGRLLLQPTHVGPLRFSIIESREKHDAPVTPLIPIIGFVIAIYLFAKYTNVQSYANGGSAPSSSPGSFLSPGVLTRAKAREAGRVEEPSPVAARKPLVRRPRTSTY